MIVTVLKRSVYDTLFQPGHRFGRTAVPELENGRFQWPRTSEDALELTPQQCRWLMEGLQIDQPKAHRPMDTTGLKIV